MAANSSSVMRPDSFIMPSFSTFALKAAISSAGCAAGAGGSARCLHGSVYGISYHTAHCAAHARHGAQANTHVGERPTASFCATFSATSKPRSWA